MVHKVLSKAVNLLYGRTASTPIVHLYMLYGLVYSLINTIDTVRVLTEVALVPLTTELVKAGVVLRPAHFILLTPRLADACMLGIWMCTFLGQTK